MATSLVKKLYIGSQLTVTLPSFSIQFLGAYAGL